MKKQLFFYAFIFIILSLTNSVLSMTISTPSVLNHSTDHLQLVIIPQNTSIYIKCNVFNYSNAKQKIELISPNNITTTINAPEYTTTNYDLHEDGEYEFKCILENNHTEIISSTFNINQKDIIDNNNFDSNNNWIILIILGMVVLIFIIGLIIQYFK